LTCRVLFDVLHELPDPLASVDAHALIMDIEGPLDWLFIMHLQWVGRHNEFAADSKSLSE
jgi:hypothetical protein